MVKWIDTAATTASAKTVLRRIQKLGIRSQIYRTLAANFDNVYYRETNDDIAPDLDLLQHYIAIGSKEGRNPTEWFSTVGYLEANPDVKLAGVNPFYHYIVHGRGEGRLPSPTYYNLALASGGKPDQQVETVEPLAKESAQRIRGWLNEAGIYSPELLRLFSVSYYRFLVEETLKSRDDYFRHFASVGFKELLPIAPHLEFDFNFYCEYIVGAANLSPVEAYKGWLAEGIRKKYPSNRGQLLTLLRIDRDFSDEYFDDEMYRYSNSDLPAGLNSRWLRIQHFVLNGAAERRPGCPVTSKTAALYVAAAENLAIKGKVRDAQRIYEDVLLHIPDHQKALNNLGDCLFSQEQFAAAAAIYRRAISNSPVGIISYINLASCLFGLGAMDESIDVLDAGSAKFPEDYGLRRTRREWLARTYENKMRLAKSYAMATRRAECGRVVDEAEAKLSRAWEPGDIATFLKDKIEKIAIIGDHALPQCRFYRIEQKLEQFEAAGITTHAFKFLQDADKLLSRLHEFDAIIFYRVPGWNEAFELITGARRLGIPTFYEIDDLIFDLEHFPDEYDSYAGLITREEYAALTTGAHAFRAAMQACDYGIASTAPLAKHMARLVRTGKVFLHRNALGQTHRAAIDAAGTPKKSRKIVLFYASGTKAHKRDFEELLATACAKLFVKYRDQIRLRLAGFQNIPASLRPFEDYIETLPLNWNVARYWKGLARCDINLAVLSRSEAADCKSEIKWMEAAMFGVPSVVSRTPNYEDVIEDGVTGYLAETPDQWYAYLDQLIGSRQLRQQVGAAARAVVEARYSEGVMAQNLSRIMEEVSSKRSLYAPRRKRVLVVNVFYPPQAIGGATRVVYDNVRDLTKRYDDSFDIEVFTSLMGDTQGYRLRSYAYEGVRVTTVSTPTEPDIDSRAADPEMERIFGRYLLSRQPDLVHFHCVQRLSASIAAAARRLDIPYVVTVHDGWWISERQFLVDDLGRMQIYSADREENVRIHGERAAARAESLRAALAGAEYIFAVSESFAQIYRGAGYRNVLTVQNGVSSLLRPQRIASPNGRVRIGYVGGLAHHKGYPVVQAAFRRRQYPNLSLLIVDHSLGLGEERHDQWGETSVKFVGKLPQHEVGELYASLDVLLAPSIWPESYGLVAREALSCGLWVVASDRGAVGECVVHGENGFLIDVDTSKGLEEALVAINANPRKYLEPPKHKSRLRESMEQADELARLYQELLGSKSEVATGDVQDQTEEAVRQSEAGSARRTHVSI